MLVYLKTAFMPPGYASLVTPPFCVHTSVFPSKLEEHAVETLRCEVSLRPVSCGIYCELRYNVWFCDHYLAARPRVGRLAFLPCAGGL
ncbi:uncharacterized protein [Paramisgurnus dabryanus]|uniref:uncharacterized protein isoform X2 n=1 Tax=Paramisgurnus dabryanus TaxID=90735 RepID=UPI003CCFCE13